MLLRETGLTGLILQSAPPVRRTQLTSAERARLGVRSIRLNGGARCTITFIKCVETDLKSPQSGCIYGSVLLSKQTNNKKEKKKKEKEEGSRTDFYHQFVKADRTPGKFNRSTDCFLSPDRDRQRLPRYWRLRSLARDRDFDVAVCFLVDAYLRVGFCFWIYPLCWNVHKTNKRQPDMQNGDYKVSRSRIFTTW